MSFLRRSWAEIDINAIIDNFNSIKDRCSNSAIMCVVKADAYGHGANYLSKVYDNLGADYYAVAALILPKQYFRMKMRFCCPNAQSALKKLLKYI